MELGYDRKWGTSSGEISKDEKERTRTREGSEWSNELSLQVRPKGISEAAAYGRLESALRENTSLARKAVRSRSARLAYEVLVRAALAKEEKNLVNDWSQVLAKSQKVSALAAQLDGADAKDVLKSGNEIIKARNDIIEINATIAGVSYALESRGLKLDELETAEILSPQEINTRLDSVKPSAGGLSREEILSDLATTRSATALSLAERGSLINGLKFSVQKGREELQRKRFDPAVNSAFLQLENRKTTSYTLGISFNLPFLAASNLGDQKDRVKLARAEEEAVRDANEAGERYASLRSMIREKVALYESIAIPEGAASASRQRQRDPVLALEIDRAQMTQRLLKAKILAEVRLLYVEYLAESGVLAEQPEMNHLSRKERKI